MVMMFFLRNLLKYKLIIVYLYLGFLCLESLIILSGFLGFFCNYKKLFFLFFIWSIKLWLIFLKVGVWIWMFYGFLNSD